MPTSFSESDNHRAGGAPPDARGRERAMGVVAGPWHTARPGAPAARLSLTPAVRSPGPLDGAWWPYSLDLSRELPCLAATLGPLWGRITRFTVHPALWHDLPREVSPLAPDPYGMVFSCAVGTRGLLVVPPLTPPATALLLMAVAADPHNARTASGLSETVGALTAPVPVQSPAPAPIPASAPHREGDGVYGYGEQGAYEYGEYEHGEHEGGEYVGGPFLPASVHNLLRGPVCTRLERRQREERRES
ncbi:DUF5994 family protein [Streptomyces iconiensis]|uniref:DUF5994 family protein n=1 Tax=Streptomyces iconiensis TaxID=1384038 RepID=A0ABT7A215_9ACTN|nr:DUF5994 family protein [Streptomyces iconiensis]MDJ1134891.1 DUF5994 family protein [Streptomyces iconiensis]